MKQMNQKMIAMLLVLVFATLAFAPANAAKNPWEKIKIPELNEIKMPEYERVELENGMILYLAEDHQFPLVELSATINVGSIYEDMSKVGLASMTGTVMRSGGTINTTGDEIDELVESRGLEIETWIGQSSGGAYLSAMKEDTDLGLELLADILRNPVFPEDKIKLAKEAEKAGISRRNDDPMTIARREAMVAVFGGDHPMARYPEYASVAAVTQQDMIDFHADWFHPDRMYLVVIGDFVSSEMVAKIETVFDGWAQATVPLPPDPEIPDFPRTVNIVDKDDLTQTTVIMGHKGIRADSPYYAGVLVGNRILGGGFATRLFNEVRSRQGLAYSVGSSSGTGFRDPGLFMAFTMTKSETSQHATEAVLTEIEKMTTELVTDEELAQAKDGILNSEVFSFDTKREILDRMVMFERYGYEPDFLQQYQANVKAMTKEQVLEATSNVWKPDQMTILAVGGYADWDGDFSVFGPVTMVDITIPEPAMEVPLASPASLEKGQSLMAAAAAAAGGQAALAGIESYTEVTVLEANIQGMDMTFTIDKQVVYPDKVYTVQKTPFGDMTSVINGDSGYSESPMGKQDLEAADVAQAHEELQTDMLGILRNLDAWTFQALDPQDVEGKTCNPVYASGVGDDYRIIYLDPETNDVVMVEQPGVSPMTQAPVTQKVYIDSYMEAGDFTMPKTMRIMYDDELFGTGTVEAFEANGVVEASLFE